MLTSPLPSHPTLQRRSSATIRRHPISQPTKGARTSSSKSCTRSDAPTHRLWGRVRKRYAWSLPANSSACLRTTKLTSQWRSGMFYTRDNRWALSRGVLAMHCTACDAELILTNVVPENTVAVRGFEHHTFICSGCHSTVRRVVFTRHGREEDPKPAFSGQQGARCFGRRRVGVG